MILLNVFVSAMLGIVAGECLLAGLKWLYGKTTTAAHDRI